MISLLITALILYKYWTTTNRSKPAQTASKGDGRPVTTGTFEGVETQLRQRGADQTQVHVYFPKLNFKTVDGRHIQTTSKIPTNAFNLQAGDTVQIVYNAQNPAEAELFETKYKGLSPVFNAVLIVGVGLSLALFELFIYSLVALAFFGH